MILLVVWSSKGDGIVLKGKFQDLFTKWRYLPMELSDWSFEQIEHGAH